MAATTAFHAAARTIGTGWAARSKHGVMDETEQELAVCWYCGNQYLAEYAATHGVMGREEPYHELHWFDSASCCLAANYKLVEAKSRPHKP